MKKISKMKSSKLGNSSSSLPAAVTSGSSTLANGKSKGLTQTGNSAQDDTNLKALRDLCHLEPNRYCFECGQRGPTYVDVTIGSFICMQCSGLLRGLTPPHRVKSISMTSFTAEEMDLLKSRGNEYCRKVWLATYTSKDTQLNSSDPDRLNALKSLMSSKYEQKRYYVDPSRLPKGELSEIQGKNLRAVVNGVQRSPSSTHSSPSPILNNLRTNQDQGIGKGRLVNSVTLPDIKPLSTLDPGFAVTSFSLHADFSTLSISSTSSSSSGGMSTSSTSRPHTTPHPNGPNPPPIQFINNLLSSSSSSSASANTTNGNHQFQLLSPWETSTEGTTNGGDECNFADFEDAFNNKEANGHEPHQPQPPPLPQKYMNGGFEPTTTLVPMSLKPNGDVYQNGMNGNGNYTESTEDRYAALKDLDSLFKQNPETGSGTSPGSMGLTSSMSVPANLSSTSVGQDQTTNGWFSTVSPPSSASIPNPFSQVNGNRWTPSLTNGSGMNGNGLNNNGGQNVHNPFYVNGNGREGNTNGWASTVGKSTTFGFSSPPTTSHQSHFGNFHPMESNGLKSSGFNPFFTQHQAQPLTSNPNNPFL